MKSMGDALRVNAVRYPTRLCLRDDSRSFTYQETNQRVNRLCNGLLALGCKPGEAIAVYARNSIEYLELFHACSKIGVRLVTLNYWLRPREIQVLFNHSQASWLIVDEERQEQMRALLPELNNLEPERFLVIGGPSDGDTTGLESVLRSGASDEPQIAVSLEAPFWMMYTSGTTGNPKGLVRSTLRTTMCIWAGIIEFRYTHTDVFLAVSPLFHGVSFLPLMVLQVGGAVHVLPQFSAERAVRLMQEDITCSFMVPTMLSLVAEHPDFRPGRFPAMRILVTGGAPVRTAIKERFLEVIGPTLYEFYGTSESGFLTVLHPGDLLSKPGSSGRACFGSELEIHDSHGNVLPVGQVGEVHSRCEGRFDLYFNEPELTQRALKDGVFATGDLGRLDANGYLYLVDRKSDLIISGGENVYPREIEDVLLEHPAVAECAVIGIPDELWGESVKALVVRAAGAETVSAETLITYCNARLAGFKRPKTLEFLPELPRNASGKVLKPVLRARETKSHGVNSNDAKEHSDEYLH